MKLVSSNRLTLASFELFIETLKRNEQARTAGQDLPVSIQYESINNQSMLNKADGVDVLTLTIDFQPVQVVGGVFEISCPGMNNGELIKRLEKRLEMLKAIKSKELEIEIILHSVYTFPQFAAPNGHFPRYGFADPTRCPRVYTEDNVEENVDVDRPRAIVLCANPDSPAEEQCVQKVLSYIIGLGINASLTTDVGPEDRYINSVHYTDEELQTLLEKAVDAVISDLRERDYMLSFKVHGRQ